MKRLKSWQKNLIFAAVVLAAAALLFVLYRANAPKAEPLVAVVDFGDGITETIPSSTVSARTMCASNSAG